MKTLFLMIALILTASVLTQLTHAQEMAKKAVQPDLLAGLVQLERGSAPVFFVLAHAGPTLRRGPIQVPSRIPCSALIGKAPFGP